MATATAATTTQEDFSFPTTTDTPPRFIGSPRLWRTTSLVSTSPQYGSCNPEGDDDDDFNFSYRASNKKLIINSGHQIQRKSFSLIECGSATKRTTVADDNDDDHGDEDHREEKMDMLWEEYFNEEFSRNSNSSILRRPPSGREDDSDDHDDHRGSRHGKMTMNFGCAHSLKLSKPNSSSKRPGVVVFMKILKKMLMLQNSHRTIKKSQ